jgi:hypothetical protein
MPHSDKDCQGEDPYPMFLRRGAAVTVADGNAIVPP